MSRAVIVAVALALMPDACAKMTGKKVTPVDDSPPPPPPPPPSATTPPIWHPPEPPGSTPTSSASAAPPAVNPDLAKARAAADAKDFKKVRTLLEKRVRAGKAAAEEAQLVHRACVALKDKACADAVKAKYPEDVAAE